MSDVPKLIRDGKVAVIISPEFGAGWSTWASDELAEKITFWPELAQMILDEKSSSELDVFVKETYPDEYIYTGGLDEAIVIWVSKGVAFRINEYDGFESIEYQEQQYDLRTA